LRRLRGSKRIFARIVRFSLAFVVFSWAVLYLSSLYECRKADVLVADLKTFPFATAGFAEVRDFSLRHGGMAIQELPETPPFDCTVQACEFQIWIGRPFSRPPMNQWLWQSLYPTLPYVGLRPWMIYVQFEVRSGVLMRSATEVGQLRRGGSVIEYSIQTERNTTPYSRSDDRPNDYAVVAPHVTGPPTDALRAWVKQTSDAPMSQVFDVDLRCFTTIFHGCTSLSTLAPSAWQHHQQK
jgi:hypothetical protein